MVEWLVLLLLLALEAAGLWWWLRRNYYPVFFSGWAALIYCAILAVDFVVPWLVSQTVTPGGSAGTTLLMVCGGGIFLIALLYTLFFRWAVRTEMTDPSKHQKDR